MALKTLQTILLWPTVLALLTLAGLTLALLEDGLWQSLALVWLSLPVAVICSLLKRK